jgi:hypothetical protein
MRSAIVARVRDRNPREVADDLGHRVWRLLSYSRQTIRDGSIPGLVTDIPIYGQPSVKTMNAEPSGRVPGFVFRQKNDAA